MVQSFLSLQNLQKQYGNYIATNNVSLDVPKGCIFGLLGPNGAGKTTLIRMITRIIFPDSGNILFNGTPLTDTHTERIGYMPEERGLYKKMKVGEHLVYLGRLKGLSKAATIQRMKKWLQKFEIENWENKRIEELSKGMSQKVQFIGTIIHEPDLLILDEPFSGLDPINSQLIEKEIRNLKNEGKTILFSTHRMEQVEDICDTIVLINKGQNILCGGVQELKQQFKQQKMLVRFNGILPENFNNHFEVLEQHENEVVVKNKHATNNELLKYLIENQVSIVAFKELLPSINEIFITCVQEKQA